MLDPQNGKTLLRTYLEVSQRVGPGLGKYHARDAIGLGERDI